MYKYTSELNELKTTTENIDSDETDYHKHSYLTEGFLISRSSGLTFQFCIMEIPSPNLEQETGYSD